MIRHHPDSAMLLEHVAGALNWRFSLGVTAHLQMCMRCRQQLHHLKEMGGTLLESAEPVPPAAGSFARLTANIDQCEKNTRFAPSNLPDSELSGIEEKTLAGMPDDIPLTLPPVLHKLLASTPGLTWRTAGLALSTASLTGGPGHRGLTLCRLAAGGRSPQHHHTVAEATLVLSGSFSDSEGLYLPGDFLLKQTGDVHRRTATQDKPCVYLVVPEAPVAPTGLWHRLARPLSGLHHR